MEATFPDGHQAGHPHDPDPFEPRPRPPMNHPDIPATRCSASPAATPSTQAPRPVTTLAVANRGEPGRAGGLPLLSFHEVPTAPCSSIGKAARGQRLDIPPPAQHPV